MGTLGLNIFLHLYRDQRDQKEHLAITFGDFIRSRSIQTEQPGETIKDRILRGADGLQAGKPFNAKVAPLVRVHSECFTGEVTWSARCDCGDQLQEAARIIHREPVPHGVIIYLRQEGRGIGLEQKLKAYNLQDLGFDTVEANEILGFPADAREYGAAVEILHDLGLAGENGIRLLTNNPEKLRAIGGSGTGIIIREVVSIASLTESSLRKKHSSEVYSYLRTKSVKMGYIL
ncbi:hypothetical protein GP486_001513 [Trichoglossum hirsutum]|uniref:GTP cyclohydrolase II n=1 Tax=Trichoglossum hirsutum TaxID=265104 RepID=A0A9P8RSK4_9PEZI|nr:hypothetical protein GP486_001513 [Trichoglossum hirsutum]